jgi:DNA mismatch repair protein MutL
LELVTALLGELERDWHLDEELLRERIAAKAACTAAIKAGDRLSIETMQDLVDDLLAIWSPATCPHGRPAFVTLSVEELERRFLRR